MPTSASTTNRSWTRCCVAANVVPWSFSSLTAFETCPKRYKLTKLEKKVVEPQTEATVHGNEVHKALELATLGTKPLEPKYKQYIPIVEKIRARPGKKLVEFKFGLNKALQPTTFFGKDVWVRGVIDFGLLTTKTGLALDWKGLALDTRLPTPTGWTTMGEVAVGDELLGSNGKPCRVVGKSAVKNIDCYQITFDDGTKVTCDHEHLWLVNGEVLSTMAIRDSLKRYGGNWRTVLNASPVELPDADLPIHPYVLGLWLGDGKHTSGEMCSIDEWVWAKIQDLGYEIGGDISANDRSRSHTIKNIRGHLTALGVLGNKHIPQQYLRASMVQRIHLVQGLFDSDGNANPTRKTAVFTNTNERLSDGVVELLASLGQRPSKASVIAKGFGKTAQVYPVEFRPQRGFNPFSLPRKAVRIDPNWGPGHSYRRLIVAVDAVPSVPTQCVAVDSKDHTYLCTEKFLVTHNTGKPKSDADQLKLFAGVMLRSYPYLEKVSTGYVWLAYNKVDTQTFTQADAPEIWGEFASRVHRMELALQNDDFPPKPSGLCRQWCPVGRDLCEFCGIA